MKEHELITIKTALFVCLNWIYEQNNKLLDDENSLDHDYELKYDLEALISEVTNINL